MQPLERGQLWVMRVRALIVATVLAAAAALADMVLQRETDFPAFLLLGLVLLLLAYPVLIGPGRRYARWGYLMDGDDLRIAHGVWTHTETLVPLGRVQHIDVSQGPLERSFGVCRLVVHTAGTMHSRVVLPGLSRPTAEGMRDEIRARLREEGA